MVGMETDQLDFATRAIEALNTDHFSEMLDEGLRKYADFDLSAIIAFPMGSKPILLSNGLLNASSPEVLRNYLNATYLLDACYVACTNSINDGLHRLSEIAPDNFFESSYYTSSEVHPCISLQSGSLAEEIIFMTQASPGFYICYSLMRSPKFDRFDDASFDRLTALAPFVCSLLAKNWNQLADENRQGRSQFYREKIEAAFVSFESRSLSPREQHIVSLMLRGHSSKSIGSQLGIAEGTVKNHRKHIYAKLTISSQSELFARFISHALAVR
jgi:DNA-binding CsgD family transcriptional regulator